MRRSLWLILGIYVILAVGCSVVNPLFEAPDEQHHYFTARQIAKTGRLPVATDDTLARQEAAQPPLYYLLSALLVAPIDTAPAEPTLWANPYVRPGHFDSVININSYVHTPVEAWPWRGYTLAAHLVRFFSVLLGLGTLVCIYASGRLLWSYASHRALMATALVAFLPQYIFLHSAVTNDVLIIFLCSAVLWQLIRLWVDRITSWRLLALGLTLGLAVLSKTTGLLLLVPTGLVIVLLVWRDGRWTRFAEYAALVLVPVILLSGWLFWRNWTLYEDFLAVKVFVERAGGDRHFTLRQVLYDLDRVWQSAIAVFGWMNLVAPRWVYLVWDALVVLGVVGLFMGGVRASANWLSEDREDSARSARLARFRRWLLVGALAIWPVLVFVAWVRFAMRTPADQGRLLFPALLPVSLVLAYGLSRWSRRWAYPVASLAALATAVYCVGFLIPQTYTPPQVIEEAGLSAEAVRFDHDMGLGLEIVAGKVHTISANPGDSVALTLYWRAQDSTTTPAIVVPEILGREYRQIGSLPESYHGGGLFPSTLWPRDGIVQERIELPLADEVSTPTEGRVVVHLDEQEEYLLVGSVKVVPRAWPQSSGMVVARLGDGIALSEASLGTTTASQGATVPVYLQWQISDAPGKDLTTFVHLGDPTQPPLAQADGLAVGGDYPSRFWDEGEVFDDRYDLRLPVDIPRGRYPVHVGLYDPQTGRRLPVWIDDVRQSYDGLLVGWIVVE